MVGGTAQSVRPVERPAERSADIDTLGAVCVAAAGILIIDPAGWFPFSIAKWPAVLALGLVSIAAAIWSSVGSSRSPIAPRLVVSWAVLLVCVVASAVAGSGGVETWIGTPIRHLGVIAWCFFAAMFWLGTRLGSPATLVRGLTIVALGLSVYVAIEATLGAPVDFESNSSRLAGPLGSAAYLGATTCVLLPVMTGLAADSAASRSWRLVAGVAAVGSGGALIGSGARAAILGIVVAAVVLLALHRSTPHRRSAFAVAGAIAGLVAVVVGGSFRVFERSAGFASRLDEWRLGLRALFARPVLGHGPEGYRLVVDQHLDAAYVRRYGDAVLPDRAHNAVLDVALTSGVLAGVAYLALLVLVTTAAVRIIRSTGASATDLGLAAALIAYVVQQQFLFQIAELDPLFWTIAGVVVARARPSPSPAATDSARRRGADGTAAHFGACALVAMAIVVASFGIRDVAADRQGRASLDSAANPEAIRFAERGVALSPDDVRLRIALARALERTGTLAGVDAALRSAADALAVAPGDPTAVRERARLLSRRAAITGIHSDHDAASAAWLELVDRAEFCASCQRWLGLTLLDAGDGDGGTAALGRAAALGDITAAEAITRIADS